MTEETKRAEIKTKCIIIEYFNDHFVHYANSENTAKKDF